MSTKLRRENPGFVYGDFEHLLAEDPGLFVYKRGLDDSAFLILLNFSAEARLVSIIPEHADLLISNYEDAAGAELRAWEACVYDISC